MLAVGHCDVVQMVLTDAQDVPEAEITLIEIEHVSRLKMEDGNFWLSWLEDCYNTSYLM